MVFNIQRTLDLCIIHVYLTTQLKRKKLVNLFDPHT